MLKKIKILTHIINSSVVKKSIVLKIPYSKVFNLFLSFLKIYGFINSFSLSSSTKRDFFEIVFKPSSFKIKTFTNVYVTRAKLLFLVRKYPTSAFLLSTSIGLICHKKAFRQNCFGRLLISIRLTSLV